MNFNNMFKKIATLFVVVFAFVACDDEFSSVGGDIIENPTGVEMLEVEVAAYNEKIGPVQSNNLPNNLLGVYNDNVYGQSVASVLTQLSLTTNNPTFPEGATLDSVVLNIPFFSTETGQDDDGVTQYSLDSVYGDSKVKLSIFESNYFLADYDPTTDFTLRQKYYSNQQQVFEDNLVGEALYVNDDYTPSPLRVVSYEVKDGENDTIVSGPALRLKLPNQFFKEKIIDREGASVLLNNDNFRNYLRGLFIKAEPVDGDGNLMLLDFRNTEAGVSLYYTYQEEVTADGETSMVSKRGSYDLGFGSNIVNTFEGDYPDDIINNTEDGSENLYLKGGEGSMAVIDLFSEEGSLEALRDNNWLINEANITFYVDQDKLNGTNEPERLYLYNLRDNTVLDDYLFSREFFRDGNEGDPLNSLTHFSSKLERNEDGEGVSYTIRLTQHVNNLIKKDSTNVKLGLVVTQNINNTFMSALKSPTEDISRVPAMSVLSPKGTVLHGNLSNDEAKRLKLKIYYTEIN